VPLAAIADDGDGFAGEGLQVSIGVVIDRGSHGRLQRKKEEQGKKRDGNGMRESGQ
jgi:hypothetical protein